MWINFITRENTVGSFLVGEENETPDPRNLQAEKIKMTRELRKSK